MIVFVMIVSDKFISFYGLCFVRTCRLWSILVGKKILVTINVLVLSVVLSRSVATRSLKLTNNQPPWVVNKRARLMYMTWEWKVSSEEGSGSTIV